LTGVELEVELEFTELLVTFCTTCVVFDGVLLFELGGVNGTGVYVYEV
jgi:hypothetical protein